MPKIIIYISTWLIVLSCSNNDKSDVVPECRTTSYDADEVVTISNNGAKIIEFQLLINDTEFTSWVAIITFIKEMPDKYHGEPLELKAFRFVNMYSFSDSKIASQKYENSPFVLLSSVGGGLCGTRSAVLTNILIAMGFQARSWCVEGHVITEVYSDDKWKVLDPHFGVYFLNDNLEIASYQELCENPDWFDDTARYVLNNRTESALLSVYMFEFGKMFSSLEDNRLYNTHFENHSNFRSNFSIPSGAQFTFPFSNSDRGSFYLVSKFSIPNNYCGELIVPFTPDKILGSGLVRINGEVYKVDSCLTNFKDFDVDFGNFEVLVNFGLDFYFFINYATYYPYVENNFTLTGSNINSLAIKVEHKDIFDEVIIPKHRDLMFKVVFEILHGSKDGAQSHVFESREHNLKVLCDSLCYYSKTENKFVNSIIVNNNHALQEYLLQQMLLFLSAKCDCDDVNTIPDDLETKY
ncbi:MAG: hypothetical protein PHE56_04875 [Bacteroidales bacterium]|nr:hypothetical protein [Bacteroidales bacterium]